MKILAVDDDFFIRELLPLVLTKAGYPDVHTAASGAEALDMINQAGSAFDCLLLDINMPGMDGIELCGHIRKLAAYRTVPIIMLTAMTEKKYIEDAFKAGATDYLTKPFEVAEVGARLRVMEALVLARRNGFAGPEVVLTGIEDENTLRHGFALADDVKITTGADCVDYAALRNYLLQLSRSGLDSVQVLAVKIDQTTALYDTTGSQEFLDALGEVAESVNRAMAKHGCIMAYAGNGLFVVISNKATLEASHGLEAEVQGLLDEKDLEFENGRPMDITISIGNPIRPSANPGQRARKACERAIERAETRLRNKLTKRRPPNIHMVR
jgi:DNA-binding response OmpR family regulator/GGDEF domain-containing protein